MDAVLTGKAGGALEMASDDCIDHAMSSVSLSGFFEMVRFHMGILPR